MDVKWNHENTSAMNVFYYTNLIYYILNRVVCVCVLGGGGNRAPRTGIFHVQSPSEAKTETAPITRSLPTPWPRSLTATLRGTVIDFRAAPPPPPRGR